MLASPRSEHSQAKHDGESKGAGVISALPKTEAMDELPLPPHHTHRVHLKQQSSGALLIVGYRIKHMRIARTQREALTPGRIIMQQKPQIGRRSMRSRNSQ